jgi:hypothetical protein
MNLKYSFIKRGHVIFGIKNKNDERQHVQEDRHLYVSFRKEKGFPGFCTWCDRLSI